MRSQGSYSILEVAVIRCVSPLVLIRLRADLIAPSLVLLSRALFVVPLLYLASRALFVLTSCSFVRLLSPPTSTSYPSHYSLHKKNYRIGSATVRPRRDLACNILIMSFCVHRCMSYSCSLPDDHSIALNIESVETSSALHINLDN